MVKKNDYRDTKIVIIKLMSLIHFNDNTVSYIASLIPRPLLRLTVGDVQAKIGE